MCFLYINLFNKFKDVGKLQQQKKKIIKHNIFMLPTLKKKKRMGGVLEIALFRYLVNFSGVDS